MKVINKIVAAIVMATIVISASAVSFAQTPETPGAKTRQRFAAKTAQPTDAAQEPAAKSQDPPTAETEPRYEGDMTEPPAKQPEAVGRPEVAEVKKNAADNKPSDIPEDTQSNRHEQPSEEAAIVPYYNNFFNTY